jgi:glycosyltransferase involved in cell wall biosynthesis
MKIWLLTSEFPPSYGGGISTYCNETVNMFCAYNHEITVITQDFQVAKLTIEERERYQIVRFNPNNYFTKSFLGYEANLSYAFTHAIKELIGIEGIPDIIESQEYMGIAYYLLQYKGLKYPLFKDLKVALTLHAPSFLYWEYNKMPLYQLPYFWVGEMEKACIRSADLLISPSKYLVDELTTRVKITDLDIQVLKNPFTYIGKDDTAFIKNKIVFFGKLIPQKGCLELLSYFKRLWDTGFEYSLLMIGGGDHLYHPEGIDMIDYIKQLYKPYIQSKKLIFTGALPPKAITEHVKDAHVIVIPSIVDNLPYTVPEVMSLGKIVLASKQGGQAEIIEDGVDGFLFDHAEPSSFEQRLKFILSLPDELIKQIGDKAINKIKNEFDYKKIYETKIELFQKLIKTKKNNNIFPFIRPLVKDEEILEAIQQPELLSVVVPYYNMGKYVKEAVISIKASSYANIEIIVVNDGSTGTENLEILNTLSTDYGIKVINKQNEGLASARNAGVKEAKGQYLAFLDPDDTVEPTYYEKAIDVLKHYTNVYFVGCWAKYFEGASGYWPAFNPEPPYLLIHNMINTSALVYKRQAFLNAGLNKPEMIFGMEDYESAISMVECGYQGVALPEPLWNYRIRKNSMARAFTKNKQIYLYRLIAEKHKKIYSIFGAEISNLLNANGPGYNYDNPTFFYNLSNNSLQNYIITLVKSNKILRKTAIKLRNLLLKK